MGKEEHKMKTGEWSYFKVKRNKVFLCETE